MNAKKLRLFFMVLMVGISLGASAQLKYKVVEYSNLQGFSNEKVMSIFHDREGFMWFGSRDGLNRFDGRNFINYKSLPP